MFESTQGYDTSSMATRARLLQNIQNSITQVTRLRPPLVSYIVYLHNNALRALQREPFLAPLPRSDAEPSRLEAYSLLSSNGISWPEIFDQDYPPETNPDGPGAKYEVVNLQ